MRFAVLTDTHFINDRAAAVWGRRAGLADILALRAVHRLNRYLKPDLVVVLGDVINDGSLADAQEQFRTMKEVFDLLACPVLYIPGNHDGDIDAFYRVFPRPPPYADVAGVRFVSFADLEEPGYNARRAPGNAGLLTQARGGWNGPIVTLQHVPIFPPGLIDCPHNYVDADDVLADMAGNDVQLAVGGHCHCGSDLFQTEQASYLVAPALCEAPFPFLMVEVEADQIAVQRHELAMPEALGLVDTHVHTQMAYCNENLDAVLNLELGKVFGLSSIRIAEHSGHLYYDRAGYGQCGALGLAGIQAANNRMDAYHRLLAEAGCPSKSVGIEVDVCDDGAPLILPADSARVAFRIGAMHQLGSLRTSQPEPEVVAADFLATMERFLESDICSLAHPFRVFRRAGLPTPPHLFGPVVGLLRAAGVAAEINFHTNDPDPEFIRLCIEGGVPLTFGSDAHNLYEIGEFFPHLQLLREAGHNGDPSEVLLPLE
jgi:histidinol phosphatase-like PHP family hydrolase/predicted phosphodiesterase